MKVNALDFDNVKGTHPVMFQSFCKKVRGN